MKKNGPSDISVDGEVKTPVINADNSDDNADWIKKVRDGKQDKSQIACLKRNLG